jgi:hypothetical protein
MMFSIGEPTRKFAIGKSSTVAANKSTVGKTLKNPNIATSATTGIIVGVGQSNIANASAGTFSPVNAANIFNLSIFDGGVYAASDPLIGCSTKETTTHNWLIRLADTLITDGDFDDVIIVPIARGGAAVADWDSGGDLFVNIQTAVDRVLSTGGSPTAFLWQQGEKDNELGTTEAAYQASLSNIISSYTQAPWFVGKSTYRFGVVDTDIQNACDNVVNGSTVYAGANTDTLSGANRQADDLHFSSTGAAAAAALWVTAIQAVF